MKYLEYYRKKNIREDNVFDFLVSTFKDSIVTWKYFTDFEKVKKNVIKIEVELAILSTLIGKKDLDSEFIKIIKEYPKIRAALPILIALREQNLKQLKIITNIKTFDSESVQEIFNPDVPLTKEIEKKLLDFFALSGLKNFFESKNIKSVVDYVYGVEVGLDSNGRKNRTGKIMESLVGDYLTNQFSDKNKFIIYNQVTATKLNQDLNISINFGRDEKGKERRIDFVIFSKQTKRIYAIEANAYMGGGSKLKSTAGEYVELNHIIVSQPNLSFIWITDGPGWKTTKAPLKETFDKIDYIFNLKMIEDGVLSEIIK
jgi:type II restriction enzyme